MSAQVDTSIRGPDAYALARRAIEDMERWKVWPTPLNFEIWLHYVGDPDGALGLELMRAVESGEPFTEEVAEALAAAHLPRARLSDEIRDAGAQLSRELKSVAGAMAAAQRSQQAYGRTLASASEHLEGESSGPDLKKVVANLAVATRKVQRENASLEKRLQESTREVGRLREHLEQVRRDAMTDALTQLANRKSFDEQLERLAGDSAAKGKPLTLALLDIDHFKRFNDTWGHQTGDQVIRYVASVLARVAVPPRVAARYGGEEFGMLFPGEATGVVEAALDSIRAEIGSRMLKRRSTNEDLGAVTISVGLAQLKPGDTPASLMERADAALYASKRSGRDCITNADKPAEAA